VAIKLHVRLLENRVYLLEKHVLAAQNVYSTFDPTRESDYTHGHDAKDKRGLL